MCIGGDAAGLDANRPTFIFFWHPFELRHFIVKNGLLAGIIPFDGHARPNSFR
jgi:hypothetical protein